MVKRITPIVVCLLAAGCTTPRVEPITAPLPLPARPELPAIAGDALQCLAPETYRAMVERDRARRDYAEQLEAVIRSTHGASNGGNDFDG